MDEKDLAVLEAVLGKQAFIGGGSAGQVDVLLYAALMDKLPRAPPSVVLWAQQMAAFTPLQQQVLTQHTSVQSCGDTQ